MDFKKPEIVSDKLIFTEKQLREFTSTYSEDIRANPFSFITDLFASKEKKAEAAAAPQSKVTAALKSTISLAALEEKTAAFVKGSIDAKTFYKVLSVAFGDKLPVVLPEICNNLPSAKAAALKKLG